MNGREQVEQTRIRDPLPTLVCPIDLDATPPSLDPDRPVFGLESGHAPLRANGRHSARLLVRPGVRQMGYERGHHLQAVATAGSRTPPIRGREPAALIARVRHPLCSGVAGEVRGVGHAQRCKVAVRMPEQATVDAFVGSLALGLGVRFGETRHVGRIDAATQGNVTGESTRTVTLAATSVGTDREQKARFSIVAVVPSTVKVQTVRSSPVAKSYACSTKRIHSGAREAQTPLTCRSVARANGDRAKPSTPSDGSIPAKPPTIVVPRTLGMPGYRMPTRPFDR